MDFLACVLVETELEPDELELLFFEHKFLRAKQDGSRELSGDTSDTQVYKDVIRIDNPNIETGYGRLHFKERDFSKCYALLIFDSGYDAGFDMRGH